MYVALHSGLVRREWARTGQAGSAAWMLGAEAIVCLGKVHGCTVTLADQIRSISQLDQEMTRSEWGWTRRYTPILNA